MATVLNSRADVLKASQALAANTNAACGLAEIMSTNIGPKGTMKLVVDGAGSVKLTKDGTTLLSEIRILHPTASMIARAAAAQDDSVGDGTSSTVVLVGELLRIAQEKGFTGVHPRRLSDGFQIARDESARFLESFATKLDGDMLSDKYTSTLFAAARTALRTKIQGDLCESMAKACVDAVKLIARREEDREDITIDLHMVEMMAMKSRLQNATRLVRGMVLDHGSRHPDMPKRLENCFILTCNVSLEYERSEVNTTFNYSSAEERAKLVASERRFTDDKVAKIIALKRKVCTKENLKTFVVLNQKGIDAPSLDALCKEGIIALRRVKRRNMERLTLCCGGHAVNSVDDLTVSDLGTAGSVCEEVLDDEKFTFIEDVQNPHACTLLIRGHNTHLVSQVKDAVKDGLRAVYNVATDASFVGGAGAFEAACYHHLMSFKDTVEGKEAYGVEVFARALLSVPRLLLKSGGHDELDGMAALLKAVKAGKKVGVDIESGDVVDPTVSGIMDQTSVKRQWLALAPALAMQLLLVDEVIKAGVQMKSKGQGA